MTQLPDFIDVTVANKPDWQPKSQILLMFGRQTARLVQVTMSYF